MKPNLIALRILWRSSVLNSPYQGFAIVDPPYIRFGLSFSHGICEWAKARPGHHRQETKTKVSGQRGR
jgi:hypothetical protein